MSRHKYNKNPYYGTGIKRIFRTLTEEEALKYPDTPVGCPPCPHWEQLWAAIVIQMEEEAEEQKKKLAYRVLFDYAKNAKDKRRAKKLGLSTNIPLEKKAKVSSE